MIDFQILIAVFQSVGLYISLKTGELLKNLCEIGTVGLLSQQSVKVLVLLGLLIQTPENI